MDCFGTYFKHVQTCNVTRVQVLRNVYCGTFFTHAQTCNVPRVQSATECILGFRGGGTLTEGFQVPSGEASGVVFLRVASRCFQRGLKGGYLKEGRQGTFRKLTAGYLKVTLRGGLRGGTLRSP